jgi:hypothetical protein
VACPRCRTDNPPSHRFCVDCGQALPTSCPRCGFAPEPGARFCGGCGQAIGPAAAVERFASPAFLALADLEPDDPAWQALDPPQRRRPIQEAVRNLLLTESRRQPVVLIVEDLQRIDEETQALLDSLVERLPGSRLLIVVAYRPEYRHAWGALPSRARLARSSRR